MELTLVILASATLGLLGALLGGLLAFAGEKMKVEVDPKLEALIEALPGLNCGACGYVGCEAAAEAIMKGEAPLNMCIAGGEETAKTVGAVFGVEVEKVAVTTLPVVHCGKGRNKVEAKFNYNGQKTCTVVQLSTGGDIPCSYGCLGYGDCVNVCPFDAVKLDQDGLPVFDLEKCTRCGLCVKACPRNLIELITNKAGIYVACTNRDKGKEVRDVCDIGCISCKLCEKNCPNAAIVVNNELAEVDYEKCKVALVCVEKCPTKCIKKL